MLTQWVAVKRLCLTRQAWCFHTHTKEGKKKTKHLFFFFWSSTGWLSMHKKSLLICFLCLSIWIFTCPSLPLTKLAAIIFNLKFAKLHLKKNIFLQCWIFSIFSSHCPPLLIFFWTYIVSAKTRFFHLTQQDGIIC